MGLRCSLLGHDFGPPETERDREERGDEVIITIRELQVCTRCGAEQVTSESTEVRPVRPAPDSVTEHEEPATEDEAEDTTHPAASEDGPDPDVEDDAVILEDDPADTPDRGRGQWPDAEDTRVEDEAQGEPEAMEAEPADTEESSTDESPAEADAAADEQATETDEAGGDWPDPGRGDDEGFDATAPDAPDEEEEYVEAPDEPADTGFVSPSEETVSVEEADAVFVCPSCAFEQPVAGSSLRSGDICPSCKKGYLTEQSP
ncbi:MAG: hypothetical protein ABEJ57_04145 [Halobacteriaceae archaeon]